MTTKQEQRNEIRGFTMNTIRRTLDTITYNANVLYTASWETTDLWSDIYQAHDKELAELRFLVENMPMSDNPGVYNDIVEQTLVVLDLQLKLVELIS